MRIWLRFIALVLTGSILFFGGRCVIAAVSDSDKIDALKRLSQVLDIVERYYVKDVPRKELVDGALKGMLQSLDPHSTLLTEEEFKEMQETTSGEFCGIGIEITLDNNNQLVVVAPIDDTPADKAGIKAGDYILAVNGRPTSEMSLQEAATLIRGPKKTEIELTILHKDSKEPITLKIKRDTIPLISVKSRELETGYYWLRISRFSEKTTSELTEAIKEASKKPLKGIVLDLRNNPGGLLDQAINVSDFFLKNGLIVSIRGRLDENIKEFKATSRNSDVTAPIVVLVNAGSASAAEIVAGALGDQKRALIIGERTFGKGSVQNVIPLADETGLKLTVALYYTPSGRSIQAEGIEPDIVIPFEPTQSTPQPINPLRMVREKDLRRHIEKNGPQNTKKNTEDKDKKDKDTVLPEAKEFLDKDNQLRMGLQLVKSLPKIREIH